MFSKSGCEDTYVDVVHYSTTGTRTLMLYTTVLPVHVR